MKELIRIAEILLGLEDVNLIGAEDLVERRGKASASGWHRMSM